MLKNDTVKEVPRQSETKGKPMNLPRWMEQAIKNQIISKTEATEILQVCQTSDQEFVTMPRHLNTACERILLWELETAATIH